LNTFFFLATGFPLLDLGLPRRLGPAPVRRGLERFRLAALKAFQPFLKPILAYFLGSPGLGIARVAFGFRY